MQRLSLIILPLAVVLLMSLSLMQDSPHGEDFTISCDQCHTTEGWKFDLKNYTFKHDSTGFPLAGMHRELNCRMCHQSLKFSQDKNKTQCIDCHTDMHEETVGNDCERCHSPATWVVTNITEIHQRSRFPLLGAHMVADCQQCHPSESELKFEPLAVECYGCHFEAYNSAESPNHILGNYSKNCVECHLITAFSWSGAGIDHSFFPLTGVHQVNDCYECHTSQGNFGGLSKECYSCHQTDYASAADPPHSLPNFSQNCTECHELTPGWKPATFNKHNSIYPLTGAHSTTDCASCHQSGYTSTPNTCEACHITNYNQTTSPNHTEVSFPTDCNLCHTTNPGWKPASFQDHDAQFFPIYSGKHAGEWTNCNECHTTPGNYTLFSCTDCHEHNIPDMNNEHRGVPGYSSNSTACYQCHPTGDEGGGLNHNQTSFPLTGAHLSVACEDCHTNGYTGTSTICADCHMPHYNQSANPSHATLGLSTDCATCHTTNPDWQPATFPVHNNFYPLTGAHTGESCASCHNGNYTNTPNTCEACHISNYNQSINPNHAQVNIPTNCESCHTTNPGWSPAAFDIHNNYYPLTGAHTATDCASCHNGNYTNTPNTCDACHISNYNQTTNPNHAQLNIPTNCESCHTTNPGWSPAAFDIHNNYYPLTGAHTATDCASCHNGNYTNTPNTCEACHNSNYNQTTNPNHAQVNIPTNCESCHTTNPGWSPAVFDIHNNYYPLTGAHTATDCASCHNGNYTNTPNTCEACHISNYNQTTNPNHAQVNIPTNCESCHTTNPGWSPAAFDIHNNYYPLTGAHTATDCASCHNGNYTNTPNTCEACHISNYNQATNPSHINLGIPTACATCHTTNPNWEPAAFPIHNNFYVLQGAHAAIANNCDQCHQGNYNNTPNTCVGCHLQEYNQTNDPPHASAQFPTNCELCHSQTAWVPSTFNHDNQYFPIYSGEHEGEWETCSDCHTNPGNYAIFSCFACHPQGEMDDEHDGVPGYVYNSNACLQCHPDGNKGFGKVKGKSNR